MQSFLDVRTTVLNDTLEDAFRQRYPRLPPHQTTTRKSHWRVMNPTGLHALLPVDPTPSPRVTHLRGMPSALTQFMTTAPILRRQLPSLVLASFGLGQRTGH